MNTSAPLHTRLFKPTYFKLWLGGTLTGAIVLLGILYLFWQPWPIDAFDFSARLQGPSAAHWLGTDVYGRDIATLLMGSTHNALWVAFIAVGIGVSTGVFLGMVAALGRRQLDFITMSACDFVFAFPAILMAILLVASLGPGITNAIIAIGIANIPVFTRLTRNTVRTILPKDYVLASKALGRSRLGIIFTHIVPNLLPVLIVQISVQFSMAILAEAALTYLGLGTQPPEPSWGRMLNEAQTMLFSAPVLAIIPGIAIALTVLGFNQLGDGLRDLLDPRLKNRL